IRLAGQQHVHGKRTEAEIKNPDEDLEQRGGSAWQANFPFALPDLAWGTPNPDDIAHQHRKHRDADPAVGPRWQLVDRHGGFRMIGHAQAEHSGIAEPKRQPGDKTYLRHFDRIESIT